MKIIELTVSKQLTLNLPNANVVVVAAQMHGIATADDDNDQFILDLNFETNWSLYLQLKPALIDMTDEERMKALAMIDIDEDEMAERENEQEEQSFISIFNIGSTKIQ